MFTENISYVRLKQFKLSSRTEIKELWTLTLLAGSRNLFMVQLRAEGLSPCLDFTGARGLLLELPSC